ncbi:unnamed protein product [Anisakis simplex]|uniref:non-specific serine/threonine protein kinase n=1 Tax=Anisakis simplex TaxID=6269 RepID=A0A158PP91_ANISI|nr:unnamed protein product [Anisakis simplex]
MPLGFFGTSSSGVKPQQLANPIEDSVTQQTDEIQSENETFNSFFFQGCSGASESRDSRGAVIKLPKHTVTIDRKLAEGGFAIVYLVSDKTNRQYALKRQFISDDTRQLEACRRECRIVSCLASHKNIVEYVDHSVVRNRSGVYEYSLLTTYYKTSVLQLINDRIMAGRCLSANEILAVFCDMCEAVARLHHSQTPVIHRDLKVENVLIDNRRRGSPPIYVLCDFGSATTKILSTESYSMQYIEEEIQRYTTLSYRAPEMIDLYSNKPIGTKIDIWALGVMLYKMCYFMLPFGESALAIQNCAYSFPTEPQYPDELRAIIKVLLEGDIAKRPDIFQTASLAFEARSMRSPVGNLNVCLFFGECPQSSQSQQQPTQSPTIPSSSIQKSSDSPPALIKTFEQKGSSTAASATNSQPIIVNINPRLRPKPSNHQIAFPTVGGSTPGLICSSSVVAQASKSGDQTDAKNICPSLLTTAIRQASEAKTADHPLGFTDLEEQIRCATTVSSSYSSAAAGSSSSGGAALGATPAVRAYIVVDKNNIATTTTNSNNKFENESESNRSGNTANSNMNENQKRKLDDKNAKTATTVKQNQYHLSIHASAPQLFHEPTTQTGSGDGNRGMIARGVLAADQFSNHVASISAATSLGGALSTDVPSGSGGGTSLKLSAFKPYSSVSTSAKKKSSISDANAIVTSEFDVNVCKWNPFMSAPYKECTTTATSSKRNAMMDDRSFGRCFDELPRSNQLTSAGGGTRNETVAECCDQLVANFDPSDPFGAAPFTSFNLSKVSVATNSLQKQQDKRQYSDDEKPDVNFYAETGCAVLEDESECDEVRMESRRRFSYEHFDGVGDNASSESRDPQDDFTSEDDDVTKAEGISDWSTSRSHEGGVEWMLSDENAQHDEGEEEDENDSDKMLRGGDTDCVGDKGRRKQTEERQLLLLLSNNDVANESNMNRQKISSSSFPSSSLVINKSGNLQRNIEETIKISNSSSGLSLLENISTYNTTESSLSASSSDSSSTSTTTSTSEFAFTQSSALNQQQNAGNNAEEKLPSRALAAAATASKSVQSENAFHQQQTLNNSVQITTAQIRHDESNLSQQRKFINSPERCSISLNNDRDQQQEHYYFYGNENKQNGNSKPNTTETVPTSAAVVLQQQLQSAGVYHQYYQAATTTTTNPFASEALAAATTSEKVHLENLSSAQTTHPSTTIMVSSIFANDDIHKQQQQPPKPSSLSFPSASTSSSPFVVHRLTGSTATGETTRVEGKSDDQNLNLNLSPPMSVCDVTAATNRTEAAAATTPQQQSVDAPCSSSVMSHHATTTTTNYCFLCAHKTDSTSHCCCRSVGSVTADMIAAVNVQLETGFAGCNNDDGDAQTRLRARTLPTTISEQPIVKTKRVSLSRTSSSSDEQSAQTTTDDSGAEMFSCESSTTNSKSPLVAAMVGRMHHHHHHQRKKSSGKPSSMSATLNASSFVNSTFQGEDFETTPTSSTMKKDVMSRKSSSFCYHDQNQTSSTKKSTHNSATSSDKNNNNNDNSEKKKATSDEMASLIYMKQVLDILDESPDLKKSWWGVAKQTGYAASGAAIGGIVGGPAGALVGTLIGGVVGYSRADPYDSLITTLNRLSDREKMRLARKIQILVGSVTIAEFVNWIQSENNRKILFDLLQNCINNSSFSYT